MIKKTTIGHSQLNINRIGLGCMGMSEFYGSFNETESIRTLNENQGALDVELTPADLHQIKEALPATTVGNRY